MSTFAVPSANLFTRSPSGLLQPSATLANPNVFSGASWTKEQCSIVTGQADPIGGTAASSLIEDNTSNEHRMYQTIGSLNATYPLRMTLYAKAGTRSWIRIGDVNGNAGAYFNVSTGVIGTVNAGSKAYIVSAGSGWYLVTLVANKLPSAAYIVNVASADNTFNYLGNGTGNLLIYTAAVQ